MTVSSDVESVSYSTSYLVLFLVFFGNKTRHANETFITYNFQLQEDKRGSISAFQQSCISSKCKSDLADGINSMKRVPKADTINSATVSGKYAEVYSIPSLFLEGNSTVLGEEHLFQK